MEATNCQDPKEEEDMYSQSRITMEKNLASPDEEKREKAMSLLCRWLNSLKDVKEEGLLKIWKGLFYCLLRAEKATVQADLVDRMANLLQRLDGKHSLPFFQVFLTALRREWNSFDKDCVDRFHLLLRHYVFHMFAVLQKNAWDAEIVSKFMNALVERALLAQDGVVADDVTVSIVGVFLHELKHYLPISAVIFETLLEPFWMMLAKGGDNKMVAESISENIFLLLFDYGCRVLASKKGEHKVEEVTCLGAAALSLSFSIKKKSISLLPFASDLNSVQLKLIQEKFTGLETLLLQSHLSSCDSIGNNCTVKVDQIESQNNGEILNSLADSAGEAQSCSISPLQFLVTRTFGRRSKRNQKLAFSPNTVDSVYPKENLSSQAKPGNALEDFVVQEVGSENRTMKDNMTSLSKNQELRMGRTFDEVISSDKNNMDMACDPPHHNDNGEIIDIDGSPPKQEAAISDEEDTNGTIAAPEDGISMEDSVISNLTKRFESIAEQSPCLLSPKVVSTPFAPSPINTGGRKRKSWRCSPLDAIDESPTSTKENNTVPQDPCQGHGVSSIDNTSAKKAKKVHFSLQHNIVWKPSTPLPPHSVRVPPSATPRGSALKKGVPPGPIVDWNEAPLVSPKKKKKATPRKAQSAHSRSPKSVKNSAKVIKPAKRGRLSPR